MDQSLPTGRPERGEHAHLTEDAPAGRAGDTATPRDARAKRIEDYLDDTLARQDPFEGMVGTVNADLLEIASELKQAIKAALASGATDVLHELQPSLASYFKATAHSTRLLSLQRAVRLDRAADQRRIARLESEEATT